MPDKKYPFQLITNLEIQRLHPVAIMEAKGATNHAHELAQILRKNPKNILFLLIYASPSPSPFIQERYGVWKLVVMSPMFPESVT
jgi:hypothetical protein